MWYKKTVPPFVVCRWPFSSFHWRVVYKVLPRVILALSAWFETNQRIPQHSLSAPLSWRNIYISAYWSCSIVRVTYFVFANRRVHREANKSGIKRGSYVGGTRDERFAQMHVFVFRVIVGCIWRAALCA